MYIRIWPVCIRISMKYHMYIYRMSCTSMEYYLYLDGMSCISEYDLYVYVYTFTEFYVYARIVLSFWDLWNVIQPIADRVAQNLEIIFTNFNFKIIFTNFNLVSGVPGFSWNLIPMYHAVLIENPMGRNLVCWQSFCSNLKIPWHPICERWGAGVETQKNVRGEIGGWGRVPFNETYAPSLSTIYDGA